MNDLLVYVILVHVCKLSFLTDMNSEHFRGMFLILTIVTRSYFSMVIKCSATGKGNVTIWTCRQLYILRFADKHYSTLLGLKTQVVMGGCEKSNKCRFKT